MVRDEESFIKMIRKQMNDQNQLQQLLDDKQGGGDEQLDEKGNNLKGLDTIIPRKKEEFWSLSPKVLFDDSVGIKEQLKSLYENGIGVYSEFELQLDSELRLVGKARLIYNEFTKMPRGQINLNVVEQTLFKKNQQIAYKDVVYQFSKESGFFGEQMKYKITQEMLNKEKPVGIKFDTFHFDEYI